MEKVIKLSNPWARAKIEEVITAGSHFLCTLNHVSIKIPRKASSSKIGATRPITRLKTMKYIGKIASGSEACSAKIVRRHFISSDISI